MTRIVPSPVTMEDCWDLLSPGISFSLVQYELNKEVVYLIILLDDDPVPGEHLWQVLELVDGDPQHL